MYSILKSKLPILMLLLGLILGPVGFTACSYLPNTQSQTTPTPARVPYILIQNPGTGGGLEVSTDSINPHRAQLRGVNLWGMPNDKSQDHQKVAQNQWANREQIVATIASWKANSVRLRLDATYYNKLDQPGKDEYMSRLVGWSRLISDADMYVNLCFWDSLYWKSALENHYTETFELAADVFTALKDNPKLFFEPLNEPNGIEWNQWLLVMKSTVQYYRERLHYTGLLVIDTIAWSHEFLDGPMVELEQYDSRLSGTKGKPQIAFASHNYSKQSTYPGGVWSSNNWLQASGGDRQTHLIIVTEFGNQNGDSSTIHPEWSQHAATYFGRDAFKLPFYGGGFAFVFHWVDANSITATDNQTLTQWGDFVVNNFLAGGIPPASHSSIGPDRINGAVFISYSNT